MSGTLRIAYVCNFASPHARALIQQVVEQHGKDAAITVFSTQPAAEMADVTVHCLPERSPGAQIKRGALGKVAYGLVQKLPSLYQSLRITQDIRLAEGLRARLLAVSDQDGTRFDVVHGLRTLPEGWLAMELAEHQGVPLALSSWGQDFVAWADSHGGARRMTQQILDRTKAFFPDNARDLRIGQETFKLSGVPTHVMPANGGLDTALLDALVNQAPPCEAPSGAGPRLLSIRGYDNIYVKTSRIIDAMPAILRALPDAFLVVDGPEGHAGLAPLRERAQRLGVDGSISFRHLSRAEVFREMEVSDLHLAATSSDGLPISLLEAMYFGLVPVVHWLESLTPPLIDGDNGVFVPSLTGEAIAEGVVAGWALARERTRGARREANLATLMKHFDRQRHVSEMFRLYGELATGSATSSALGAAP